jgi:sugar diacid utilization regulator/GAF domain-containing protein
VTETAEPSQAPTAPEHSPAALAGLYEVATRIIRSPDLDEVLLAVANAAGRLLGAEVVGVLLHDLEANLLRMACTTGHRTTGTTRLEIAAGQGVAGRVLVTGEAEQVLDYTADERISQHFVEIAREEGIASALCTPNRAHGRTAGVLCAWRRRRQAFEPAEVSLLAALADLAAMALDRASLLRAQRDATEDLARAHRDLEVRADLAERQLGIWDELTGIALDERDLGATLLAVRRTTGGAAVLLDEQLDVIADEPAGSGKAVWELAREPRRDQGNRHARSEVITVSEGTWLVTASVRTAASAFGHLCVLLHTVPTRGTTLTVEQAARVCALQVARIEAEGAAIRKLQAEFLWDLLEQRVPDEADALFRARQLERHFALPARVALVSVPGIEWQAKAEGWSTEQLIRTRTATAQALANIAGGAALVAGRANDFAVVAPAEGGSSAAARRLGEEALGVVVGERPGARVGVSGPVHTMGDFPDAYRQAQFALTTGDRPGAVTVFEELGVMRFLLTGSNRAELDSFAAQVLRPLIDHDQTHGGELLKTLEAYLAAACNVRKAAELLFVHYKTVHNRLRRISELTSLDLDSQEHRFNAHLALKIMKMIEDPAPPEEP